MHPRSRLWYLLDFVLVRRRDQAGVLTTIAILDADGWTDHHLVISKMRIRLQPCRRPQGKRAPSKLNIALLSFPAHHLYFSNELAQSLTSIPVAAAANENALVENRWCPLRDTVQSTTLDVIGRARREHQECFDDDAAIINLLAEESRLRKAHVPDVWTTRKADEIQGFADCNEWKIFFAVVKVVYGPTAKRTVPLLSADGSTLLPEKKQILQRWAEQFRSVLNRPSTISDIAIARRSQVKTNAELDLRPLSTKPSGP
nr:unnamed protein product [Spirometra erinaceieuropaei]